MERVLSVRGVLLYRMDSVRSTGRVLALRIALCVVWGVCSVRCGECEVCV